MLYGSEDDEDGQVRERLKLFLGSRGSGNGKRVWWKGWRCRVLVEMGETDEDGEVEGRNGQSLQKAAKLAIEPADRSLRSAIRLQHSEHLWLFFPSYGCSRMMASMVEYDVIVDFSSLGCARGLSICRTMVIVISIVAVLRLEDNARRFHRRTDDITGLFPEGQDHAWNRIRTSCAFELCCDGSQLFQQHTIGH